MTPQSFQNKTSLFLPDIVNKHKEVVELVKQSSDPTDS